MRGIVDPSSDEYSIGIVSFPLSHMLEEFCYSYGASAGFIDQSIPSQKRDGKIGIHGRGREKEWIICIRLVATEAMPRVSC